MEKHEQTEKRCANSGCGRSVAAGKRYCDNCELEWTLYRRDLRVRDREKEVLALKSR